MSDVFTEVPEPWRGRVEQRVSGLVEAMMRQDVLDTADNAIVVLAHGCGLSYTNISDITGQSPSWLKERMRRARGKVDAVATAVGAEAQRGALLRACPALTWGDYLLAQGIVTGIKLAQRWHRHEEAPSSACHEADDLLEATG